MWGGLMDVRLRIGLGVERWGFGLGLEGRGEGVSGTLSGANIFPILIHAVIDIGKSNSYKGSQ